MGDRTGVYYRDADPLTVGDLRRAMAGLPDHAPVQIFATTSPDGESTEMLCVIEASPGRLQTAEMVSTEELVSSGPSPRHEEVAVLLLVCDLPPGAYFQGFE